MNKKENKLETIRIGDLRIEKGLYEEFKEKNITLKLFGRFYLFGEGKERGKGGVVRIEKKDRRLEELVEKGLLTKKVEGKSAVYEITDIGKLMLKIRQKGFRRWLKNH